MWPFRKSRSKVTLRVEPDKPVGNPCLPDGDPSRHDEFVASTLRFVGEQDGLPERDLKAHLATLLRSEPAVHRAYLARVQYESATHWDVALCLAATAPEAKRINERIGRLFAGIFRPDVYLDVLFLSERQEIEVAQVCAAFYHAS